MADAITTLHLIRRGRTAESQVAHLLGRGARETIAALQNDLAGVASGAHDGKLVVRVDGSAGAVAAGTVVADQSNCTAGDALIITVPGFPAYVLTCVATDAEVTAAPGTGLWSIETATDDATGASLEAAINSMPGLMAAVVADNTSGSVAITARVAGSLGNSIGITKDVTTSGALTITAMTGGANPGARPTATATFGTADVANDDTISVGGVTFTWKAAPSGENQLETSATQATAASRFAAGVNAHSKLKGLVSASVDTAIVTLTWLGDPRTAQLISLARTEANAGSVTWSAAAFTPLTTESYGGTAPNVFAMGAP